MTKMTYVLALDYALDNLPNAPQDVQEKLVALKAQMEKRGTAVSKAEQAKAARDAEYTKLLIAALVDGEMRTIADLQKLVPECADLSNQKMSGLLSKQVAAGVLAKKVIKRQTFYSKVA